MWALAYVEANRELKFRDWLQERNIQSLVVTGKKLIKPQRKRKSVIVEVPIFLHYVFVSVQGEWNVIRHAPGFYYFISIDNEPVVIDVNSIAQLMQLHESGIFDEVIVSDNSLMLMKGSRVEILKGPFEGKRGLVLQQPRDGFSRVFLDVEGMKLKIGLSFLGQIA